MKKTLKYTPPPFGSACASLCDDLGIHTLGVGLDKLIIDFTSVLTVYPDVKVAQLQTIQFHTARLCCALHSLRFYIKKLGLVPKRTTRRQGKNQ